MSAGHSISFFFSCFFFLRVMSVLARSYFFFPFILPFETAEATQIKDWNSRTTEWRLGLARGYRRKLFYAVRVMFLHFSSFFFRLHVCCEQHKKNEKNMHSPTLHDVIADRPRTIREQKKRKCELSYLSPDASRPLGRVLSEGAISCATPPGRGQQEWHTVIQTSIGAVCTRCRETVHRERNFTPIYLRYFRYRSECTLGRGWWQLSRELRFVGAKRRNYR